MQDVGFSSAIQSAWLGWDHGCKIELKLALLLGGMQLCVVAIQLPAKLRQCRARALQARGAIWLKPYVGPYRHTRR